MLLILFYLSQSPEFINAVKPISEKLKNSEEMLRFMKDLSHFSELFGAFSSNTGTPNPPPKDDDKPPKEKENPRSPTDGIADEFIGKCLSDYFKRGKSPR